MKPYQKQRLLDLAIKAGMEKPMLEKIMRDAALLDGGYSTGAWLKRLRVFGLAAVQGHERVLSAMQASLIGPGEVLNRSLALEYHFAHRWAICGFPQVVVDDKLFATFAAMGISSDFDLDVGSPWDAFVLRIPDQFKALRDWIGDGGESFPVSHVSVVRAMPDEGDCDGRFWSYRATIFPEGDVLGGDVTRFFNNVGDLFANVRNPSGLMLTEDDEGNAVATKAFSDDSKPLDLYWAILGGVLLELMSPGQQQRIRSRGSENLFRVKRGQPKSYTFALSRDVKVDCRDIVRRVLLGEQGASTIPKVQSLIRGHWKRQPFGVGSQDRKIIHIEPYWRGPEDAPIAVRSHVLSAESR